ncbi:MAG: GNAT family N-acetyltransferase [Candidatus Rokuibacteriota bacterium]|nr:MAG: GNAT family N-acetyltransferase [Candidatus Rokubacteria bacterium]
MRGLPKGDRPDPVRARAAPLPVSRDLHGDVLALNNAHAVELSWLEPGELFALLGQAFYARRVGKVDAFLLAFDQDATYDSPNYRWFCERYPRFVYVDRVVVTKAARGRGLARLLYADLFRCAMVAGHDLVVCEANVQPPNPASEALHAALGFSEVGRAAIYGGDKTVRYLSRPLGPTPK